MAVDTVDEYVAATAGVVRQTIDAARSLVLETVPQIKELMKWGAPVYLAPGGTPVLYLYGGQDHVNIGFVHGVGLADPDKLLKGKGKEGRHVSFRSPDELEKAAVIDLIRAAVLAADNSTSSPPPPD